MLPAEMGGGAVLTFAGKKLVFAPETVDATIAQLQGVLDLVTNIQSITVEQPTGKAAGQDFASAGAVTNLTVSAGLLHERLAEATTQVQAAIDNLRANGSAYTRSDVAPGPGVSV